MDRKREGDKLRLSRRLEKEAKELERGELRLADIKRRHAGMYIHIIFDLQRCGYISISLYLFVVL